MLIDGIYIMIVGMVVVLSFLCLLILTMHASAKVLVVVNKYFPEPVQEKCKLAKVIGQNDEIAVVVAAVKAYIKG